MRSLNRLGSRKSEELQFFHGPSIRYKPEDFIDIGFLSSHLVDFLGYSFSCFLEFCLGYLFFCSDFLLLFVDFSFFSG